MKRRLLFFLATLLPLLASAYDAEIDGIYYNFSGDEATVTYKYGSIYSGDVVIPTSVTYNGKTYSVTIIGNYAFQDCNVTSVTIPNSVTSIGNYAFLRGSLTSVSFPNSVTSIGENAFEGCGLTSISIGSGLTSIGNYAFNNCTKLTAVHITDLAAWCNISFEGYNSQPLWFAHHLYMNGQEIKDLVIPNSVRSIGNRAFDGCSGLASVGIPGSVTSIGEYAFSYCSGLTSINIPNSVTTIESGAFLNCSGLLSISIGSGVTSIGSSAFYGCSALTDFYCSAEEVPSTGSNVFNNSSYGTATLHVPTGSVEAYRKTAPWSSFGTIVPISSFIIFADANVKAVCVANWDTNGDGELTEEEAAAVTGLGTVFKGNKNITSFNELQYFTGLGSIGPQAFYGCNGLTSITIPENVTSIDSQAFYNCSLTSITIPNSVTSIGGDAFYYCSSLTSVTIPSSLTSIGSNAFSQCNALTAVHITDLAAWCNISFSDQPLSYAHHLYLNGHEITDLIIPEGVTQIRNAFRGCIGLTSVTIPNSVTSIGGSAFEDCSGLTSVTIPNSLTIIGDYAFSNCALTFITLPNSVTSIGKYAFDGCKLHNVLVKCSTPPSIVTGTKNATFSNQTLYHATLYVPTGCWDEYAYNGNWYLFHNIRETATSEEQVSMQQAYTLMDASTFAYSVYDPVNNCIGTLSVNGIDENNPNHSWQVIEAEGNRYLYNMGAKKFVASSANGTYILSDAPAPINMADGDNGIILGTLTGRQWALVSNESMSVEQAIIDGISLTPALSKDEEEIYNLAGQRLGKMQKGINITGGRKVLVR